VPPIEYEPYAILPLVIKPSEGDVSQLSVEVTAGWIARNELALETLSPPYVRVTFGTPADANATLYQAYKAGGWNEVDGRILPVLDILQRVGAEPILHFVIGGACQTPSYAVLAEYGDFVGALVNRYGITYFEPWNEPDAKQGIPSLYGCFGSAEVAKLNYLADRVRPLLPAGAQMGMSFMLDQPSSQTMLESVAAKFDWIGVHHYPQWYANTGIFEVWPGSVQAAYNIADAATDAPVWVTEVNVRDTSRTCSEAFQADQLSYVQSAFRIGAPVVSVLVYSNGPDWDCTGVLTYKLGGWLRSFAGGTQ